MFRRLRRAAKAVDAPNPNPNSRHVPAVSEVRRLVRAHRQHAAVRLAYERIIEDLQRAYSVRFAPGWTHPEILRLGFDGRMTEISDLLSQLYEIYRPIRFGPPMVEVDAESVTEIVENIYGKWPMFRLYLSSSAPSPGSAEPDVGAGEGTATLRDPWRTT